jgi:hypothetical protein
MRPVASSRRSIATDAAPPLSSDVPMIPTLATISRDNYLDGREPKLNFRSDMPQAFDRVLGALLEIGRAHV